MAGGRLPTSDATPSHPGKRSTMCPKHLLPPPLQGNPLSCLIAATTKMSLCRPLLVKDKALLVSVLMSPADGLEPSAISCRGHGAPPDLLHACRSQR